MSKDPMRDRFARLKQVYLEAQNLPQAGRAGYLDQACEGDADLRREVEGLLGASTSEVDLDPDAAALRASADASTWSALIGQLESRGPGYRRYVFEGEIARGGMGVIHRVFDQDVRRLLALKVMLGEENDESDTSYVDDDSLGRFLEEAQVTGQLDHPGIVPVHEVGVDGGGNAYFTMKLVKGEDLRSVFDRVANPSDEEWTRTRALSVMLRVCEAMAYAHEKGVIHRDLKPGNVMVGKFGEAYVMDWGLARVMGKHDPRDLRLRPDASSSLRTDRKDAVAVTSESPIVTMDGAVVGTPAYMPPEQARGRVEEMGPTADVYAVGAMLYHLLSGRMPYTYPGDRLSPRTILALVSRDAPPALAEVSPDAPSELIAIVEKAMTREIAGRYPDMNALATDLRAFLEDRVVSAHETGAWAELKKWVYRNKALATTALAAVVVVCALVAWSNIRIRSERNTAVSNEVEANLQRGRADQNAAEAKARADALARLFDALSRLSDKRRLEVLIAEAGQLWPAHPDKLGELRMWLERAEALLANLPLHEATLSELRSRGTPLSDPREEGLEALRAHHAVHMAGEEFEGEAFADEQQLALHVTAIAAEITVLEETIARERAHDFGEDDDARWWHDAVRDLVVVLHALEADDVHGPTVSSIEERVAWAESVAQMTTTGADVAAEWKRARVAIQQHPLYRGLMLERQIGLVPLGPDPTSTLWEFGHPRTGDVPTRDSDSGVLAINEHTGLVFVLIPGGTHRLGAQKTDPNAPHFDPRAESDESPVHEVTLAPYFLSKYEMTQGQWARVTGKHPSQYQPPSRLVKTLLHPVEQVSWGRCRETLFSLGLLLPTEAQWEAACRAGTGTPWWTGRERDSLIGAANLADRSAKRAGATWREIDDWPELDDGFGVHAPVGSYRANAFGLHDMHGNLWEWCRDGYSDWAYEGIAPSEGDGFRQVPGVPLRVLRGGSFDEQSSSLRSAVRGRDASEGLVNLLGVRPSRALEP